MSEVVDFSRKYRPARLSDYVGNAGIVRSALSFLSGDPDKRPQVILLNGHSGCGKTTFARLLCSCYSCEHPLENGDACGECDTCREFAHYIETGDEGGLMNIQEVDITTAGGKAATEDLIQQMQEPSYDGKWKCFILDECHLMSNAAQSSLLKPLEDIPEKVLVCLCTTNPEKLLDTITSRCQCNFKVQKPKRSELIAHLEKVCQAEGVSCDHRGLSLISTKGNMVPRDSLKWLQTVIRERGNATYASAVEVLDIIADKYYFAFYEQLLSPTIITYQYIGLINKIANSLDLNDFLSGLINFTLRGIYVYNNVPLDGLDEADLKPLKTLFAKCSPSDLVFLMSHLTSLRGDPDLEIKLLQLGYTGINHAVDTGITTNLDALANLDSLKTDAASDATAGRDVFIERTEMNDSDRQNLIKENTAPMELSAIEEMFQAKSQRQNRGCNT